MEKNSLKVSQAHFLWLIAFASLFVFATLSCLGEISIIHSAYAQSICYFELAWFSAQKAKENHISITAVLFSLIAGRLVFELPIRIVEFQDTLSSLMTLIFCLICIILGIICNRVNKPYIYTISLIIVILLNSVIHNLWIEYISNIHN